MSFPRTPKGSRAHCRRPRILTMVFVGILHIGNNGGFELYEFSQDPERLPCALSAFWHPDRVFCDVLGWSFLESDRFV